MQRVKGEEEIPQWILPLPQLAQSSVSRTNEQEGDYNNPTDIQGELRTRKETKEPKGESVSSLWNCAKISTPN